MCKLIQSVVLEILLLVHIRNKCDSKFEILPYETLMFSNRLKFSI